MAAFFSDRPKILCLFTAVLIIAGLSSAASYGQAIPGMSPREKAALEEKKAQEKNVDETYKSTLKRIPDTNKSADPWGNMRTPAASPGAK
jgi:hypothetical protein